MNNKIVKRAFALILSVAMLICACGCDTWTNFKNAFIDPPEEPDHVIKIGVYEPLTGRTLYDAKDEIAGIELAYSLYPSALGYDIQLIYEDNHSSKEECASAAQKLVDQGCCVVLGSVSDVLSLAGSDVFKENKIAAIAATNTNPLVTQTNYYYFRTSYINTFDAQGAAYYAYNELKADKVAVLYQENSDLEISECEKFESTFVSLVGTESFEYLEEVTDKETNETSIKTSESPTVKYVAIDGTESDLALKDIFNVLERLGYTTIFCPGDSSFALKYIVLADTYFNEQKDNEDDSDDTATEDGYSEQDPTAVQEENTDTQASENDDSSGFFWIGTDEWEELQTTASENYTDLSFLENTAYTIDYDPNETETEISKKFLNAYKEAYGEDAVPSDAVALGFDAYLLAYNAILACQTNESGEVLTKEQMDTKLFDDNGVFTRTGIAVALYKIRNMEAVTGYISIDDNGDPVKDLYIRKFDGKEYNVVYTVHPDLTSKESIE